MIDVKELRALYESAQNYDGEKWNVPQDYADCYGGWEGCLVEVEPRKNALITAMHNAMPELLKMAEWCVGRCVTCALFGQECPKERFSSTPLWADHGPCTAWKPAWEE